MQQKSIQIPIFAQNNREGSRSGGGLAGLWGDAVPQTLRVQVLDSAVSEKDVVLAKSFIKRPVQSCFSQCVFSLLVLMFRHSWPLETFFLPEIFELAY